MDTVHELLEYKLQGVYAAEKRNLEILEDAMEDVEEPKLREALEHHHKETRTQVERVEKVFASLGRKPRSVDPSVIEGIVEERRRFLSEDPDGPVMDAFVLGAAMKTEHVEIATYEEIILLAEKAGASDVVAPLRENLQEERATLEKLRGLATDLKIAKPEQKEKVLRQNEQTAR